MKIKFSTIDSLRPIKNNIRKLKDKRIIFRVKYYRNLLNKRI